MLKSSLRIPVSSSAIVYTKLAFPYKNGDKIMQNIETVH